MADDHETIYQAIARIPSGCSILTAATARARTGMLASWVQQASFEPPAVSVAVRKGRPIEAIIDESKRFALNLVGDNPAPLFRHFGKGFSPEENAFEGLAHNAVAGGVALADAIAVLSCEVAGKHDAGDHWIYIGRVTGAESHGGAPYVHLRKNGGSY